MVSQCKTWPLPWLLYWVGPVLKIEEVFWYGGAERQLCCFTWQEGRRLLFKRTWEEEGSSLGVRGCSRKVGGIRMFLEVSHRGRSLKNRDIQVGCLHCRLWQVPCAPLFVSPTKPPVTPPLLTNTFVWCGTLKGKGFYVHVDTEKTHADINPKFKLTSAFHLPACWSSGWQSTRREEAVFAHFKIFTQMN